MNNFTNKFNILAHWKIVGVTALAGVAIFGLSGSDEDADVASHNLIEEADKQNLLVGESYSVPHFMQADRYQEPKNFTFVTFAGQNTNGEDLKCLVYTNASYRASNGAGGASCNWTAPTPQ